MKIKKIISLLIACTLSILCFAIPVYAESDSDTDSGTTVTRDNSRPTANWNLSTNGQYNFSGYAAGTADIYSLYNFTGVDPMCISVRNLGSTYTITVKLIKNALIDYTVETFTVAPGQRRVVTVDVSSTSRYYLSFSAPCSFDGFIL